MKIKKYYTSYAQAPFELWDDEELTIAQKGILNFIWSITAHRDGNKAIILLVYLCDTPYVSLRYTDKTLI